MEFHLRKGGRLVCDLQGFYHIEVFLPVFYNIWSLMHIMMSTEVPAYICLYIESQLPHVS